MNTLSIFSIKQGIAFDAETAVRGFAIIERIAAVTGAVFKTIRGAGKARLGGTFRPAQA
jgi:hypothetical protein